MKPKIFFITGGCGFIGSNFIRYLLENTDVKHIINLDKLTYAGSTSNLKEFNSDSRYIFIEGDITDAKLVYSLFQNHNPDCLVHFAAESHVDRSIDGPDEFINTNIIGTFTLLEESLRYYKSLSKNSVTEFLFHHISTDEVFGSLGKTGSFTENTPYDPSSPYSAAKASSDHLVRAWYRTFGLPVLITNCSNNYGPYQFPEKLIPLMIINCLNEKPLPVYGKGDNIRDWLYVEDHCTAIISVLQNGILGETYNIGGRSEISNLKIVETICDSLDEIHPSISGKSYRELITFVRDRPGHDFRYSIDASKIEKALNWVPDESFETGIRKTIQWYLDHQDWWQKKKKKIYKQERLGAL
jgi:dTDP-glucose 4,6-dehydratase